MEILIVSHGRIMLSPDIINALNNEPINISMSLCKDNIKLNSFEESVKIRKPNKKVIYGYCHSRSYWRRKN